MSGLQTKPPPPPQSYDGRWMYQFWEYAANFIGINDLDYTGSANQLIKGNAAATAFEYATLSGTSPIVVTFGVGTITLSHATSGVTANPYGGAGKLVSFTVNSTGHLTAAADVNGAALTKTDDTNVTLTLGGSPTTALVNAASLTLGWTGTLAASRGGTGVSSLGDLTKSDDTNVTLTLGGTPTGSLIKSVSLTLGWSGQLGLTRGGTAASLTASNGGVVYSTSSALAILSGTATANQVLLSGTSAAPSWSTMTYLSTITSNRVPYATGTNALGTSANMTFNGSVLTVTNSGAGQAGQFISSGATNTLILTDTGANGCGLQMTGNGATTPTKFMRANSGNMEFINNAFSAVITSMTDAGSWTMSGTLNINNLGTTDPGLRVNSGSGAVAIRMYGRASDGISTIAWLTNGGTQTAQINSGNGNIFDFYTGSSPVEQFKINHTASADAYPVVTGSNGGNPSITASAKNMATSVGGSTSTGTITNMVDVNLTDTGNVGTGEDDLQSLTLPASSLSANKKGVRYSGWGKTVNNGNAKTLKVYAGASLLGTMTLSVNVVGAWYVEVLLFRNGSSTQKYTVIMENSVPSLVVEGVLRDRGTLSLTDTNSIVFKCTGTATSDNDIVQEGSSLEMFN